MSSRLEPSSRRTRICSPDPPRAPLRARWPRSRRTRWIGSRWARAGPRDPGPQLHFALLTRERPRPTWNPMTVKLPAAPPRRRAIYLPESSPKARTDPEVHSSPRCRLDGKRRTACASRASRPAIGRYPSAISRLIFVLLFVRRVLLPPALARRLLRPRGAAGPRARKTLRSFRSGGRRRRRRARALDVAREHPATASSW